MYCDWFFIGEHDLRHVKMKRVVRVEQLILSAKRHLAQEHDGYVVGLGGEAVVGRLAHLYTREQRNEQAATSRNHVGKVDS